MENLNNDINFILEIDKMKRVKRQSLNLDKVTFEDDAQHSFHVALAALTLKDYADREIDINKVVKMLLVHDLVEIYAGDTFAYDTEGYKDKYEREMKAANKIFSLPSNGQYLKSLFLEFDKCETDEALFANTVDRLEPIMLNYFGGGGSWKRHNIKKEQVYKRIEIAKRISTKLYQYGISIIDDYFDI